MEAISVPSPPTLTPTSSRSHCSVKPESSRAAGTLLMILADEYSCDHLVALNDLCNGVVQQSDPLQIPNKEKESHKGEQQSVVHAAQNMPVDQQYKKQDQPGGYWIRYPICNGQQTEEK